MAAGRVAGLGQRWCPGRRTRGGDTRVAVPLDQPPAVADGALRSARSHRLRDAARVHRAAVAFRGRTSYVDHRRPARPGTGDAMIRFDDVTVTYPDADRPVLERVDLTIPEGELCLVVGRTGSGKST